MHIDALTFTLRTDRAAAVLATHQNWGCEPPRPGKGSQGFRQSEDHPCLGGRFWRKFEPVSESKLYGLNYESWEALGAGAGGLAMELLGVEGYATRVDIAFDFFGGDSMKCVKPEHLVEPAVKPESVSDNPKVKLKTRQNFVLGFSGEGGCNTAYVGGKASDRRIRIYRKDLQSPGFADWAGPCMRVELVLRGPEAKAWWALYRQDREAAYAAAGAHIEAMMGWNPKPGGSIPEVEVPADLSEADSLFQFIEQNASRIIAYEAAGIDIRRLCRARIRLQSDRATDRFNALRARLQALDPTRLVNRVLGMMVKRARAGSA